VSIDKVEKVVVDEGPNVTIETTDEFYVQNDEDTLDVRVKVAGTSSGGVKSGDQSTAGAKTSNGNAVVDSEKATEANKG
jgi:hypothetical protein